MIMVSISPYLGIAIDPLPTIFGPFIFYSTIVRENNLLSTSTTLALPHTYDCTKSHFHRNSINQNHINVKRGGRKNGSSDRQLRS